MHIEPEKFNNPDYRKSMVEIFNRQLKELLDCGDITMMERVGWVGLAALVTFVIAASICEPALIASNGFMLSLVTPEIINISVVMLTVSLPVAYQIMRLISKDKREVRKSEKFHEDDKPHICEALDGVIGKVKLNSTLMIAYFFGLLLTVFIVGAIPESNARASSLLMGLSLYLLCHMTLFMVELYIALNNWRDMDDITEEGS